MRAGFIATIGAWLHPETSGRSPDVTESRTQFRAGVVGVACIASALGALALATIELTFSADTDAISTRSTAQPTIVAVFLIAFCVFTPQAIFRTRNAARTRELLDNPSTPIQPWQASTLNFDAVLVGGMLAGLYLEPWLTLELFMAALLIKVLATTGPRLQADPNARFHVLIEAWMAAAVGLIAYMIVSPLAPSVNYNRSPWPMVLAGLAAMALGLGFNATQRWVYSTGRPWALLIDATDSRRIIVALLSAALAWAVAWADSAMRSLSGSGPALEIELSSLAVFVGGWLLLWCASIWMWRRDAKRTLNLWGEHQAQIVVRLAGGSLSNELAQRAALPTVARMAIAIFGATRAMSVVDYGGGRMNTCLVSRDRYESAPVLDASALRAFPHMHVNCYPNPSALNMTGVTIASWLWPGWFITRSPAILAQFSNLAALTLVTPMLGDSDTTQEKAFDCLFDPIHRWPTLAAFGQAMRRMQDRADASPHNNSLVIAVFAIDEFGALSDGRFEQAAVAQIARLAMGHGPFAGHDLFLAYEAPGRIWLALAGGPIVRNGITLLRELQQGINDQGSIHAHRLDVDVHVSISMGYAAHQVDDFTPHGLMATAESRLATDVNTRNSFTLDSMASMDIRPEDIIGEPEMPLTVVDVLQQLRDEEDLAAFPMQLRRIDEASTSTVQALMLEVGWNRMIGNVDLASPADFLTLINRQPELAAAGTQIMIDRLLEVLGQVDRICSARLPIVLPLPSVLLGSEVGHLAMPNLVCPLLDRSQSARTVLLFDRIAQGSGQSLRVLADRGFHIAVSAEAAAAAEPDDLIGWSRWAIMFPQTMLQGSAGVDSLTIQQTVAAISGQGTRLIGEVDSYIDARALVRQGISGVINPDEKSDQVAEILQGSRSLILTADVSGQHSG